ncbi:hypothetical protein K474DRAFT_1030223 [Panus rudis PR-1116 ss-1]|nr:hypothetical protein K474DRAFT_1030223 [Panus rudis PR-1116 ss-1]
MSSSSSPSAILWDLYVRYLWNYEQDSWVASIAYTSRVMAFLVVTPFVILTLIDVISYVIARTLGVIDDTKAATSEEPRDTVSGVTTSVSSTNNATNTNTSTTTSTPPTIRISDESESERSTSTTSSLPPYPPRTYFSNPVDSEGEGNLKLSGVDAFSPAPSQPPSPTLSRRDLSLSHMTHQVRAEDLSRKLRHSGGEGSSPQSSSGESSFAILEKEDGSEDGAVQMRKRRTRLPVDVDQGSQS